MAPEEKTPEELEDDTPDEILDMSDEDFANLPDPGSEPPADALEKEEEDEGEAESSDSDDEEQDDGGDEEEADDKSDDDDDSADDDDDLQEDDAEDKTDKKVESEEKKADDVTDEKKDLEEDKKDSREVSDVDYKAEYEKLMAPFKANGQEIQIKSVDDAIQLMQMGANYHKKMVSLKPALKALKLLENNDLLDIDKLNFLIDLNKKDKNAITKLVKDAGINPMDVDVEAESSYTPTSRTVSDAEIELDQVLESIQDSPVFNQTLKVVSQQWDSQSRSIVANNPQIIAIINAQIEDGTYEKIASAVAYERSLGRLVGVSDFEAYKTVGDQLYQAGQLIKKPPQKETETVVQPDNKGVKNKNNSDAEAKRKKKKKAASSTRKITDGKTSQSDFNPLALSDEEFEKLDAKQFGVNL